MISDERIHELTDGPGKCRSSSCCSEMKTGALASSCPHYCNFSPSSGLTMKFGIPGQHLSILLRLYIYGLHGYFIEVMFTAAWEFTVNLNWKFPGCTSVWSLFIYAISVYAMEIMYYNWLKDRRHILIRALIYLIWSYTWEFSTGFVLRYFNACPWDYTAFTYDIHGLITLEYAPLWFVASILTEQLLIKNVHNLRWSHDINDNLKKLHQVSECNGALKIH